MIKRNIFTVYRKLCITENICVSLFKTLKPCSLPLNCIYFVFSKCSLPFKMLGKLAMSIAFITRVNNIQFKLQSTSHVPSSNFQQSNQVCIVYCKSSWKERKKFIICPWWLLAQSCENWNVKYKLDGYLRNLMMHVYWQ